MGFHVGFFCLFVFFCCQDFHKPIWIMSGFAESRIFADSLNKVIDKQAETQSYYTTL